MYRSEGHRLLKEHPAASTAIAAALDVSAQTVRGWRDGNIPRRGPIRDKLHAQFGIPNQSWELPPAGAVPLAPALPPPTHHLTVDQPTQVAVAPIDYHAPDAFSAALFDQCERLRATLDAEYNNRHGSRPSEIVKLEEAFSKAIERAAKAAGKLRAIDEHRMTKTASFRDHVAKVKRICCEDCLRKLAEELPE